MIKLNGVKEMKKAILIPIFFVCIAAHANTGPENGKFAATLPNGATVELIGVSYRSQELSQPKRWWRPDGTDLAEEPYRHSGTSAGGSSGYKVRDFALRITGVDGYSCASYNSLGRTNVQPVVPIDKENKFLPGVLAFVGLFEEGQFKDTIRIGVSTEPWQKVEEWVDEGWHEHDPDNIVFTKSTNPLILTWPRQKGEAVILEMVSEDVAEAKHMLLFDRNGQVHEEHPRILGQGPGLVKEQYWFWHIQREDMDRIEFQTRPYQWVEFRNVSLEPDHKTNVEIEVLSTKEKMIQGLAVSEHEKESLGCIFDGLAKNLRFPESGRVKYRLEENTPERESRVLNCEYVFDGCYYKFSIIGEDPNDFNYKWYFDGRKTIDRPIRDKTATFRDNIRQRTPIYSLEWAMPDNLIEELLTHNVELMGSYEIKGIPCFLLDSVIRDKDRLKVWVAKEPDIYPTRIERFENDNLREVFEFENIKLWGGVVFPRIIKHAFYGSDENVRYIPLSSYTVTVESFTPNIEIASSEFIPDFPDGIAVGKYPSKEPQATELAPTIPARYLQSFSNINIDFDFEQSKDKMLLVCFFDMQQRPSRNCIMQLSKRAQELKSKDIVIVVVQASKIEKDTLNEWIKVQGISFPVGMIEGDSDKVRFAWGVKSLPWLILTDRNHIVTAEGFSLNELEEKIKNSEK
jgi:hypothetical protein